MLVPPRSLSGRRRRGRHAVVLGLLLLPTTISAQQPPGSAPSDAPTDGRSIYLDACAGCHGPDGQGMERALVAFEEELPDFTDCSFASREPQADWIIVAHQGGPVRAFSEMMPAFGEALDEEELERVVAYVSSLCTDSAWPRGELNLPRSLVTEKAYPEDEWVLENEGDVEGSGAYLHTLVYEKRFGARSQLELALPFGFRRTDLSGGGAAWSSGFGDVAIGIKHALVHGLEGGRILSVVGEVKLPTGEEQDGFGSEATAVEGFLAFGQLLPSDAFVQLQAGAERSTAEDAETELFWTGVLGKSIAQGTWGRTWTPMIEVAGKREGDEPVEWDVLPQLHVTLSTRQHIMLTVGPRIPVAGADRPAALIVNFLWDWFDGGLFDGW